MSNKNLHESLQHVTSTENNGVKKKRKICYL